MFEDISNALLTQGNRYLSFQFYILSGRFSIQYILDTYLEGFIEQAQTSDIMGLGGLLTACVHKLIEQVKHTRPMSHSCSAPVYAFMRGCTLIDNQVSFESFVDLLHGKKFKYVRPGNNKDGAGQE